MNRYRVEIYFDGACHNKANKETPMGVGVYCFDHLTKEERKIEFVPLFLGTSNVAEWVGCMIAHNIALEYLNSGVGVKDIIIYGDSQNIINQVNGEWTIKKENFRQYYTYCKSLSKLSKVKIKWIERKRNQKADALSKFAIHKANKFFDKWQY